VRFGLRMLAKNRAFTAVAVITLALGIGGTTAIFSVVYGALLDPLPYADSHRLAVLLSRDTRQAQGVTRYARVSASEFLYYREKNHVFDEVIGGGWWGEWGHVAMTGTGNAENYYGVQMTDNAFRVLGVPPQIGRSIIPEDCKPGAPLVAVLSHSVWQSKFGADPAIVGRKIILNHQPATVVGVMPPRFLFLGGAIWLPAGQTATPGQNLVVMGRLKPGATIEQAQVDMAVLAKQLAAVYPKDHPNGVTLTVDSLVHDSALWTQSRMLFLLMGAVSFLLLIACVNVANLFLARAAGREKEFAIRASLGASRIRLVRQLMIESLLVALGGAVLGCLVLWDGLGGLVAIIPPGTLPGEAAIRINSPVLLFTLGAALLSTLLIGLAPALHAVRRDLQTPLKASDRGGSEGSRHRRLRNLLVASEVALSLILLTGAGLLIRSFFALRSIDLGYNPDNVLEAGTFLPVDRYKTREQKNEYHLESLRRVRGLPGVVSATLDFPNVLVCGSELIEIDGAPSEESRTTVVRLSGDRYFETMGIRLLQGRTISEQDMVDARKVAVVNQAFVSKYFGDKNPLGRQIKPIGAGWAPKLQQTWFEIVGVVEDTRYNDTPNRVNNDSEPVVRPTVFLTLTTGGIPSNNLLIRTAGDPVGLANAVRQTLVGIDKELPVWGPLTLREHISSWWYTGPRFVLTMFVAFASLGLVMVIIGVYGVVSYHTSQRTHEIGIRMALGAEATDVRRMVMMSGLRWLAVGIGIGVPASIALARILQNRIWGIKSADPLTLLAVSLVLTAVGLAACYIPARRATKIDPMVALRYE